jgi:S1-C subfamily serine protease
MPRSIFLLLALLLIPSAGCASAQAQRTDGAASAAAAAPEQTTPPRRTPVYTGLDIRHSASVGADGVPVPAYPVVTAVEPRSPGQQAGIAAGDQIVEVNGRDSRAERALWMEPGVRYTLRLRNGDAEREVVLVPLPTRDATSGPAR